MTFETIRYLAGDKNNISYLLIGLEISMLLLLIIILWKTTHGV